MRRRDFIALIGGAVACPFIAHAGDTRKIYRILWLSTASGADPFLDGFREGLRAQGYVEGKNIVLQTYYGDMQGLRDIASNLKRGDADLAVSSGVATRAVKDVTEIPVLFAQSGDPVALGIVKSLAQPGTNFTGTTFLSLELAGKRVELLKDVFPRLRRLAVLSNSDHPGEQSEWRATQQAAKALDVEPVYIPFFGPREFDAALASVAGTKADAMLALPEPVTLINRKRVAQFAVDQRLPSMFGWSEYCEAGGLSSYGANQRATYFLLATYADRILRGENPAELPVVQPDKFELAVNLKTAGCWREARHFPPSCSGPARCWKLARRSLARHLLPAFAGGACRALAVPEILRDPVCRGGRAAVAWRGGRSLVRLSRPAPPYQRSPWGRGALGGGQDRGFHRRDTRPAWLDGAVSVDRR